MYKNKRLNAQKSKVEIEIGNSIVENFGFKYMSRTMPMVKDMISLKLIGNYFEHFNCSDKRLNKIESMIKTLPNKRT